MISDNQQNNCSNVIFGSHFLDEQGQLRNQLRFDGQDVTLSCSNQATNICFESRDWLNCIIVNNTLSLIKKNHKEWKIPQNTPFEFVLFMCIHVMSDERYNFVDPTKGHPLNEYKIIRQKDCENYGSYDIDFSNLKILNEQKWRLNPYVAIYQFTIQHDEHEFTCFYCNKSDWFLTLTDQRRNTFICKYPYTYNNKTYADPMENINIIVKNVLDFMLGTTDGEPYRISKNKISDLFNSVNPKTDSWTKGHITLTNLQIPEYVTFSLGTKCSWKFKEYNITIDSYGIMIDNITINESSFVPCDFAPYDISVHPKKQFDFSYIIQLKRDSNNFVDFWAKLESIGSESMEDNQDKSPFNRFLTIFVIVILVILILYITL
jgi:hypothetical protein